MEDKDQILISKIQAAQSYDMYFGLLALVDKSRTWDFKSIKDKSSKEITRLENKVHLKGMRFDSKFYFKQFLLIV